MVLAPAPSEAAQAPHIKWIDRWPPQAKSAQFGVWGGFFAPSTQHELFEPDIEKFEQGHKTYAAVAPSFGARLGYNALSWIASEAEFGVMPTHTGENERATLFAMRGHLVVQAPYWSVTPFFLLGGGALAVSSGRDAVGTDLDPSVHLGFGLKVNLNRWLQVRVDARDSLSSRVGHIPRLRAPAHHLELTFGLGARFGRAHSN